jgi:hypothetical protein
VCGVERTGDESVSRRREKEKPSRRAFLQLRGGGVEGLVKSMTTREEEEEGSTTRRNRRRCIFIHTDTHATSSCIAMASGWVPPVIVMNEVSWDSLREENWATSLVCLGWSRRRRGGVHHPSV